MRRRGRKKKKERKRRGKGTARARQGFNGSRWDRRRASYARCRQERAVRVTVYRGKERGQRRRRRKRKEPPGAYCESARSRQSGKARLPSCFGTSS
jgi:hypothetical protein